LEPLNLEENSAFYPVWNFIAVIAMKLLHSLDETAWNEFLLQHDEANVFLTPEMFAVFSNSRDYSPELWAVQSDDGRILALFMPVFVYIHPGPLRYFSTRLISYCSPIVEKSAEGEKAKQFLFESYARKNRRNALFTEIRPTTNLSKQDAAIRESGFSYYDYLNFIMPMNLTSDELSRRAAKSTRRQIQRAEKNRVFQVSKVEDLSGVHEVYELLIKTYRHARVPLADISLFENAFQILHPRSMIHIFLFKHEGQNAAAHIDLTYKDIVFGWYGGSDRRYSKLNVSEYSYGYLLSHFNSKGFTQYDFGGAGRPEEKYGVRDHKAKFGGDLVNYGRYIKIHAPIRYHIGNAVYQTLRKIRGFFPSNH
jgi:lipid II:glycine glycyltransferase (peptidoglycan interpeptide bridge formation enzyme)